MVRVSTGKRSKTEDTDSATYDSCSRVSALLRISTPTPKFASNTYLATFRATPIHIIQRESHALAAMLSRPRRNRKSPVLRAAHRETHLGACNFCLPLFIHESEEVVPVESMPGCSRLSLAALVEEVAGAIEDGIGMVEVRVRAVH